jgi:hypothetical protein
MRFTQPAFLLLFFVSLLPAQNTSSSSANSEWKFVVSGDSRNCGNVIMPSIAAGAIKNQAAFYWHLGDLRATYGPDEDYEHEPEHRGKTIAKDTYLKEEWDDFLKNQVTPFGSIPVFIGIGNHETIAPRSREQFVEKFAKWLDADPLKKQRLADDPNDTTPKTYFHWVQGGVDFIYLDNATKDQLSADQMKWVEGVIKRAASNADVHALVVGMHAALPDSVASGHSMNDWNSGLTTGRQVFTDLLNFKKQTKKNVYILASHSHFYMSGIFHTEYRKSHGGELPGWIVGTAGAVRYSLPDDSMLADDARTKIYGYLVGTVHADGKIDFKFEDIKRSDIPAAINQRYTPEFVNFCFEKNTAFK